MSLSGLKALLLSIGEWIRFHLAGKLGLTAQEISRGISTGVFDMVTLFLLVLGLFRGSQAYMDARYNLPVTTQETVLKWAVVSDYVARTVDIPREVPLVLWFKENSMLAVNPDSCTGIMGAYDLVRSGERPCFTPGPINDIEVAEQLLIGAQEYKKRCPEITYLTHDPDMIQRCYLAYNAGTGAAARLDPTDSAYVMNNYDDAHTNMVYSDIELGTVHVTALGAWPTHLAFQSLIISRIDGSEMPVTAAIVDTKNRLFDSLWALLTGADILNDATGMDFPHGRDVSDESCLGEPHRGRASWRPNRNPVSETPVLTQDVHGCSYGLPGLDISSSNRAALLQAPMPGELTTYTDRWYNSTIRIENEEWIVWLLHPRTYLLAEGEVRRGQAVGVMGAIGNATGPHVHYTVYDKVNQTFVDPGLFLP
jgi:hypothetical protein